MKTGKNLILYVMDSLRPDHLSCYGYVRPTSPHLDRLVSEGVLFSTAFAQGTWTRPSAGSLMTGCYPEVHGAINMQRALRPAVTTLAQALSALGYRTGAVVSIVQLAKELGFAAGFDRYVELWDTGGPRSKVGASTAASAAVSDRRACGAARRWLESLEPDRPFFLMIWAAGTHIPYHLPPVSERLFVKEEGDAHGLETIGDLWRVDSERELELLVDQYDEAIHESDSALGTLLDWLRQQDRVEDCLIAVLADHGEVFNEHGRGDHWRHKRWLDVLRRVPGLAEWLRRYRLVNRWGLAGHLDLLPYDELLRIPLVMRLPRGEYAGTTVGDQVRVVDVAPTVLDALGHPQGLAGAQGCSFMPQIRGAAAKPAPVYSDSQRSAWAPRYQSCRTEGWKLIRTLWPEADAREGPGWRETAYRCLERWQSPSIVLFRTGDEHLDVASSNPAVVAELTTLIEEWHAGNAARSEGMDEGTFALDEVVEERLRALGYLD
jgi:arylsulfatase A-like enzyme